MKKFWKFLRNSSAGHLIILSFLVFVLKLPILISPPPPFWDEMVYVEAISHLLGNRLNPFTFYYGYRPPFVMWTTALLFHLFGNLLLTTRLIIALWAILAVIFTYFLTFEVSKKKVEAFLAGALLALSPFFFAQAGRFQIEIPLAALTIITAYFYIKKRWLFFGLAGVALILTKEPGMVIFGLIFGFDLFRSIIRAKNSTWALKKILAFFMPISAFLFWISANKLIHGWWLWPYNFGLFTNFGQFFVASFTAKLTHLRTIYSPTFGLQKVGHGNSLVFILVVIGMVCDRGKFLKDHRVLLILFLIFAFPLFFLGSGEYVLMRYLLPTFPLIFSLLGIFCAKIILGKKRLGASLMILFLPFFISSWYGKTGDREANMSYLEIVKLHQELAGVVEDNYSGSRILTHWPFSRELQSAFLGYVKKDNDSIFIDEDNDGKSLDEWLLDVDYVLTEENHYLTREVLPYSRCLMVERRFSDNWEVVFLYRVDKLCLIGEERGR
ncbi:glycosyltransferase family 39 protein [Candidatus Microgenomates bacterium]|nr:glycosyltransferase family 39 protein [Candidatus Microgenomates bacterium]